MDKQSFALIETYMISCMEDSAHDREHIYRVLYNGLEIAEDEEGVDYDVLIGACLLHDIGRSDQFKDPSVCHARAGAEKAYRFLAAHHFGDDYARRVKECIRTHRFRKSSPPESIEAKILFDADKLDVSGAIGIARTLIYKGTVGEPIYTVLPDGKVSLGESDEAPSFFQEYKYKLENLYAHFYTKKGLALARERKAHASRFYNELLMEVTESYEKGRERLSAFIPPGQCNF